MLSTLTRGRHARCPLLYFIRHLMRPPTEASAKKRAWQAFALYIRKRDLRCVTCGGATTEAGHFFHTSDKASVKTLGGNEIWYDERNVNGQCGHCNRWKSGNQVQYALFLEEKYGMGILQTLRDLFNTPRKWTLEEVLAIEEQYKSLV